MPDIRSFFGGKAGEGAMASQEKPKAKDTVRIPDLLHYTLIQGKTNIIGEPCIVVNCE